MLLLASPSIFSPEQLPANGFPYSKALSTSVQKIWRVRRQHCVNVYDISWEPEAHPSHHIRSLIGDGCSLENGDAEYQILFSNSVIEHVGSWENQCKFVAEARRVDQRLWIQTPAYECQIEPHYLAPFVHWVPTKLRCFVARWLTPWGWIENHPPEKVKEIVESTRLLTRTEFQSLLPDCEILTEKMMLVFRKSYIAIRS